MQIIISPAKKMREDTDCFAPAGLPRFLPKSRQILAALRAMTPAQLQKLWACNDEIAALNLHRLETMDLEARLTPAVLAYDGIQYQNMAPGVLEEEPLRYLHRHLRILSGLYGVLAPFDGVTSYRLEMQARLPVEGSKNLYAFWGSDLADALAAESDTILNLASKEYSKAVQPHLPEGVRFISVSFCQRVGGKLVERATLCKMARGRMVRWLAVHGIEQPEGAQGFDELDFRFSPEESDETNYVFIKEEK